MDAIVHGDLSRLADGAALHRIAIEFLRGDLPGAGSFRRSIAGLL
jgi:hypothetical protein